MVLSSTTTTSSSGSKFGLGYQGPSKEISNTTKVISSKRDNDANLVRQKLSKATTTVPIKLSKMESLKRKMNMMLESTEELDKKTVGKLGSKAWECRSMIDISMKMKEDEADNRADGCIGTEIDEKRRLIAMINADTETIFENPVHIASESANQSEKLRKVESNREKSNKELLHFDAMFSATTSLETSSVNSGSMAQHIPTSSTNRTKSTVKDSAKLNPGMDIKICVGSNMSSPQALLSTSAREGGGELPLWKLLESGMEVEGRYSGDGGWYPATIKQVIHGGFPNALYTLQYDWYQKDDSLYCETRSWRDIKISASLKQTTITKLLKPVESDKKSKINIDMNQIISSSFSSTGGCKPANHFGSKNDSNQAASVSSTLNEQATIHPMAAQQASTTAKQGGWRAKAKKR